MPNYFQPDIECAPREKLREIQSQRLVKMVKSCYENVPFYKRKFDAMGLQPGDIRSIDDIVKLPFTEKQDLRDTYPFGLLAVPRGELARIHASSGTTGKQTVVAYTQNDLDAWATGAARAIVAVGGRREDLVHVSYGYGLFTGGLGLHDGASKIGARVVPASSGNTARQLMLLKDFKATTLYAQLRHVHWRDGTGQGHRPQKSAGAHRHFWGGALDRGNAPGDRKVFGH